MEAIDFGYSMKNIPITSKHRYKLKLTEKVESVLKRMRWKANFFDGNSNTAREVPQNDEDERDEEFELKTQKMSQSSERDEEF